jgi:hypothetical protein
MVDLHLFFENFELGTLFSMLRRLSTVDSNLKCNRTLFVTSPQRGEMFKDKRSSSLLLAPEQRNRFARPEDRSAARFRS